MIVVYKKEIEKEQLVSILDRLEFDVESGEIDAFDLLATLQAYEIGLQDQLAMKEREQKALTYLRVATSTLEGK